MSLRKPHDLWNVYRIGFEGCIPIYPTDFCWREGGTYALGLAGGKLDKPFHTEADFLRKVAEEPPQPGCHFIIVLLGAPDLTDEQVWDIYESFGV